MRRSVNGSRISADKRRASVWLFCCLVLLSAVACSRDLIRGDDPLPSEGEEVAVRMRLYVPPVKILPESRVQTDAESRIKEVELLVFENGKFRYRTGGTFEQQSPASATFSAVLRSTSSPVTLCILANAGGAFSGAEPVSGTDRETFSKGLHLPFAVSGIDSLFPMYGELRCTSGIQVLAENVFDNIKMLRGIARVQLNADPELKGFEPVSLQVFRAGDKIQLLPDEELELSAPAVKAPSLPDGYTAAVATTPLLPGNVDGNLFRLYLPEASAPEEGKRVEEAVCLVVGGKYAGSSDTTYYRIDFNSGAEGHPFGQILRNHLYDFVIRDVSHPGWTTAVEAANNYAAGLTVEVRAWNEYGGVVELPGGNYLEFSTRTPLLGAKETAVDTVWVSTDLEAYSLYWSNEQGEVLTTEEADLLENDFFRIVKAADGSYIALEALQTNNTGTLRQQYVVLVSPCGSALITVRQKFTVAPEAVYIRVLSLGTIGNLGDATATGDAAGMRALLLLADNFGPSGKVKVAGITLERLQYTGSVFSDSKWMNLFRNYDILNITYGSGINTNDQISRCIVKWLQEDPGRVLFVTRVYTDTNTALMNLLGFGSSSNWVYGAGYPSYYIEPDGVNDYFTLNGPFGALDLLLGSKSIVIGDGIRFALAAGTAYMERMVPLLRSNLIAAGSSDSHTLAVDTAARIVLIGESQFFQSSATAMNTSGLLDVLGVRNNANVLFGNLWAWAIEKVVLPRRTESE